MNDYTQMQLHIRLEMGNGYASPGDLRVVVPHSQLVSLMAEPVVRDAIRRAEEAERKERQVRSAYQALLRRGWWARLRNRQ